MNKPIKIIAACILWTIVGQPHAVAQANEPGESFTVDFRVYGLRPGQYEDILYHSDSTETDRLKFKPKQRSDAYAATLPVENPLLSFYRQSAESLLPAGSIEISPNLKEILLIFVKNTGNDPKAPFPEFKIYAIPDDRRTFPEGSLRILNITDVEILGSANGSTMRLSNGQCSNAKRLQKGKETAISIAAEGATRHHLLYKNRLKLDPSSRSLLILRPPVRSGSLRIGGHLLSEDLGSENSQ